ncbi:MAG: hypothetical protein WAZ77_02765 [Candidatus Nitrosopolaris sp.]
MVDMGKQQDIQRALVLQGGGSLGAYEYVLATMSPHINTLA